MGDSESKNYDNGVPQDAHAMDRMQEHYDRINHEIQRAEEEMLRRRQQAQAPVYDPHGNPYAPMPRDPNDGLYGIPPVDYDTWRNGKQQPTASQIDPKLLERLRQSLGGIPMPQQRKGHTPYVAPKAGVYQVNGRKVIVDEMNDLFRDAYLGDYPHMEPMTRKQEVCRHHPVNVGFNTDKWVCKICDKDLDTPVDNSYK